MEGIEIGDLPVRGLDRETATSVVAEVTHSAMRFSGTSRKRTPRPAWA